MFQISNVSNYRNIGHRAQQNLVYHLFGELRKADRTPFDRGSDIPEYDMEVKSYHFTLASNLNGSTYEEMKADFFNRCHSKRFAYVTRSNMVYVMNRSEFSEFLDRFHEVDRSSKGVTIIRGKREPKAMLQWLDELDYMKGGDWE